MIYNKLSRGWFDFLQPDLLSLEDPHDFENDVGRSSFDIELVKKAFADAFEELISSDKSQNEHPDSLLSRIIQFDRNLRNELLHEFR